MLNYVKLDHSGLQSGDWGSPRERVEVFSTALRFIKLCIEIISIAAEPLGKYRSVSPVVIEVSRTDWDIDRYFDRMYEPTQLR